jgi:predicted cupin superfamily sugar epimerase
MSACDPKLTEPLKPSFKAAEENALEAPKIKRLIYSLYMLKNPEGGWFVETDRDPLRIPNPGEKARIETFVVGHNIEEGERLQWIVEGDIYKASYLLPDNENSGESESGLLISEASCMLKFRYHC